MINDDRSSFLARIHNILSSSNPPPFELHLFGSSINLLGSTTADADLTIIASGSTDHPYSIINKLRKVLHRNGMRDIVGIKFARVPICKFKEPWSNISCDINFGHALGVYNSKLLRAYVSLDSRVRPFLLLIKTFAKARGINDPSGNCIFRLFSHNKLICLLLNGNCILAAPQDSSQPTTA